ncbi:MAG: hypothetical protein II680_09575 [Clostridia bacterium]|nr:hypothetical protein [Clostridia bacterium]
METDFGIIPAPKLDEEQDRYYNVSAGSYFGMNIPVSAADPEYVSIVLEGLNSMSCRLTDRRFRDSSYRLFSIRNLLFACFCSAILIGKGTSRPNEPRDAFPVFPAG